MTRMTATALLCLALPACAQDGGDRGARNTAFEPAFPQQFRAPLEDSGVAVETTVVAGGLQHPWAVAALPDGGFLVTERSGALRHVGASGDVSGPLAGVPQVFAQRQGGLLDVKLGPDFASDRMVYLTYAKPTGGGRSATAAGRGRLNEDMTALEGFEDIFVQDPPSATAAHYGSRIVFDGAGHAFVTTGEHFTEAERQYAQDLDKTYGKVVRIGLDGSVPSGNPFAGQAGAKPEIWSYGHRNVQSAVMRGGQLWTVEHGPQGGDELNRPEPGANYGWPVVSYGQNYQGTPVGSGEASAGEFTEPVYWWDPVIAPGDIALVDGGAFPAWQGDFLIGGLVAPGIVRLAMDGDRVAAEERILTDYGRVRDVEMLPDGSFVFATDYADGEIVRVTPAGG